ncbi:MAG: ribonuclease J [Candidatus Nealsonbacteria bacterium]
MIKKDIDASPVAQGLRIIPLGGLGEVGRNMMCIEYEKSILIVDVGFRMPEESMPGVDYIIPDITYLKGKEKNVVGVVFTHGHYDHIGAVPYIIERLGNPPLFASGLTAGIILKRQEDFSYLPKLNLTRIVDGTKIKLGPFTVEFFKQNHNIADNMGLFIQTPIGNLVHTSDFKFDDDPVFDTPTNFKKLQEIGSRGILLLMSDSTGSEEQGHSLSERKIMENLEEIFKQSKGRVIAATFGSLINRIQQLIALSEKYGRKVAVDGYSMRTNVEICKKLGYIKSEKSTLIKPNQLQNFPDPKVTLICTGAQGEGQAVLMRIANGEHKFVRLKKQDTVIFSSSVVPGNERTVQILKDELYRQQVRVFHYKMMDIHAGGHGQEEELKEMMNIMKPKFFVPIHGQYSMLVNHAILAAEAGIPEKNIAVVENGQVIALTENKIAVETRSVESNYIMVDGLGVGDVGEVVLRDRQTLSQDGMFVIVAIVDRKTGKVKGSPDIISRGFVYLKESRLLLRDTRQRVIDIVEKSTGSGGAVNWSYVKDNVRNYIGDFLYSRTQRRPMVLPVIIEV